MSHNLRRNPYNRQQQQQSNVVSSSLEDDNEKYGKIQKQKQKVRTTMIMMIVVLACMTSFVIYHNKRKQQQQLELSLQQEELNKKFRQQQMQVVLLPDDNNNNNNNNPQLQQQLQRQQQKLHQKEREFERENDEKERLKDEADFMEQQNQQEEEQLQQQVEADRLLEEEKLREEDKDLKQQPQQQQQQYLRGGAAQQKQEEEKKEVEESFVYMEAKEDELDRMTEQQLVETFQRFDDEVRAIRKQVTVFETHPKGQNRQHVLQNITRSLLHKRYGKQEPYRVELILHYESSMKDYDVLGSYGRLVLELAPSTIMPYAIYYFLEIVRNYDKGEFHVVAPHVLMSRQTLLMNNDDDTTASYRQYGFRGERASLAFQEYSNTFPHHERTVGFAGRPGGPIWYISSKDNSIVHGPGSQQAADPYEADSCFGRIIEGYDELLLRTPQLPCDGFCTEEQSIKIQSMNIMIPTTTTTTTTTTIKSKTATTISNITTEALANITTTTKNTNSMTNSTSSSNITTTTQQGGAGGGGGVNDAPGNTDGYVKWELPKE